MFVNKAKQEEAIQEYMRANPYLLPSPPSEGPKPFINARSFSVEIARHYASILPHHAGNVYFYDVECTATGYTVDNDGNPSGEKTCTWKVPKRFSECIEFYDSLSKYCTNLPPQPDKNLFHTTGGDLLIAKRRIELKDMLNKLVQTPFVSTTSSFTDFFHINDHVQMDRRSYPQLLQSLDHPTADFGFNKVLYDATTGVLIAASEKVNLGSKVSNTFSSLKTLWSGPKGINGEGNLSPTENTVGMLVCYIYNSSAQEWRCMYRRHFDSFVTALEWDVPDRRVFLGFQNGQVCSFQASPNFDELNLLRSTQPHRQRIDSLLYIAEKDALVTVCRESQLVVQRASSTGYELISEIQVKEGRLSCAYDAENDYLYVGSGTGKLIVYRLGTAKPEMLHVLCGHKNVIRNVRYCPQTGYIVTGGFDASCGIWTTAATTGAASAAGVNKRTQFVGWLKNGCKSPMKSVEICPQANTVATGFDNGIVELWDTQSGSISFVLKDHVSSVVDLVWVNAADMLITAGRDGKINFYSVVPSTTPQ